MMSEYWVSKDRYFCKYCKIYIADDKPSRTHHDTGLRHKGNYERYIRDIYKRGEKDAKDKVDEAREMAKIEAAAHAAMGSAGPSSAPAGPPPGKKAAAPDAFANYSTAASLGFDDPDAKDEAEEERLKIEAEELAKQGNIGQWEVVKKKPKPPPLPPGPAPPLAGYGTAQDGGDEKKRVLEEEATLAELERLREEEERPTQRRWLQEKSAALEDDEYDPSKVGPIKVKRQRLTLREEEEIRLREEAKQKEKDDVERERKRARREAIALGGKGGWQEVALEEEPLLEFEEAVPQEEVEGAAGGEEKAEVEDAKIDAVAAAPATGFKKRKGNPNQRKK